jgi:hypothetical protein
MERKRKYSGLGSITSKALSKTADAVQRFDSGVLHRPSVQFKFEELREPNALKDRVKKELEVKCPFVYLIFARPDCDIAKAIESFRSAQIDQKDKSFSRLNGLNPANHERCFYVGSSNPGYARFNQHFGLSSPKTYSLQLSAWAKGLGGGIEIDILEFPNEPDSKLIRYAEDALAETFMPVFGRRGAAV